MIDAADELLLARAVAAAERGLFSVTANPRVGCVLVRDQQVLGVGAHLAAGTPHAEVNALAAAREAAHSVAGATAYVSLEPCCHAGRTGACTERLIDARIARVVGAMRDPDPRVAGQGYARLRSAGIAVDETELAAARRLNHGHERRMRTGRPFVRVKVAQSLDGRTAMASGESKWITGAAARREVQYWRARSGAVLTGRGTVVADDPALTVRDPGAGAAPRQPLRVVLDSALATPADAQLATDGHPTLLAHGVGARTRPYASQVSLLPCQDERPDLAEVLDELGRRGCNEVLVEAGAELVGELLARELWDEMLVYVAPRWLGRSARPSAAFDVERLADAPGATLLGSAQVGDDTRIRLVRDPADSERVDDPPLGLAAFMATDPN
ncbi:MAG: bifunctional diaminohydroxyphosphoribosylaminopyrimidine deaminase/5-amino-6-(5-phosphoribosylamino)uracil reductase RibD [Pseudomonadota bacterium]